MSTVRPDEIAGPSRVRATHRMSNTKPIPRPQQQFNGFSTEVAQLKFAKIKNKKVLPDKRFDRRSIEEFSFIQDVINKQGWQMLCEVKNSFNLSLIREFYAEACVLSTTKIKVWGV